MLQKFYPDRYLRSAYEIDYGRYYEEGYRGIIFDIDNTLVPHGAPADERSIALIENLKGLGFGIMLLSNNKEPRVKMFNDAVKVSYIFKAGKPARRGYEAAGNGSGKHPVCGRPAVYGRVGGAQCGDSIPAGAAHRQEGGDPDCSEKISGKDRALLL